MVISGCLGFNFWQGWEFIHSPIHNGSEVYQHPINTVQDAFLPGGKGAELDINCNAIAEVMNK